jgi:oligosaccharide repeat unit polymerase
MSSEFLAYAAIALAAWLIAFLSVGARNALDLSRCAGWYLLVFFATYVLRPALSQVAGDLEMYKWLRIGNFEDHWQLMAVAVPLAIVSFGIGYSVAKPKYRSRREHSARLAPALDPHGVRVLIYFLIFIGYFALAVSLKTGTLGGEQGDYAGAAVGVYEHNTAWFAQADLLVSTGVILYYILTGNLGKSLLPAVPWMIFRLVSGWGRSHLLGLFFALMGIYFLKSRSSSGSRISSRQVLALSCAVLFVLILFPILSLMRGLRSQFHLQSLVSKDLFRIVERSSDPAELIQGYVGTGSSITGFEQTLSHLLNDPHCDMGSQYLYYFFFKPIPRIIWRDKGTPYTWAQKLGGVEDDPLLTIIGAAPGSIGMAYQEWSWPGIVLEFLFTGWFLCKMEELVRHRPERLDVQLAYAGIYSMLPQMGRDSLLYMIANFWLFKFSIPVMILWFMYRKAAQHSRVRRVALPARSSPSVG